MNKYTKLKKQIETKLDLAREIYAQTRSEYDRGMVAAYSMMLNDARNFEGETKKED